jgi:hypothetical protein
MCENSKKGWQCNFCGGLFSYIDIDSKWIMDMWSFFTLFLCKKNYENNFDTRKF